MSRHSVAEAQARLPELIARAAAGEEIVIAADDGPEVTLHALPPEPPIPPVPSGGGEALVAWFDAVRVGRIVPGAPNAAELIRKMRD